MSKIDPNIWIGTVYNAHDKDFIHTHRITAVLSCAKEFASNKIPSIEYYNLPITDDTADSKTEEQFREGAATLDMWINLGHTVIVHCHAGISRSVSVVIAYYIMKGLTYEKAYSKVKSARPAANIYPEYIPILKRLERQYSEQSKPRAKASRIIVFNPTCTKVLVGKESYFYRKHIFTRKVNRPKSPTDKDEIDYYSKKIRLYKGVKSKRLTFGDIRYIKKGHQWYSYTILQYVPTGTPFSFPGGKPKLTNSDTSCALRELYEETGVRNVTKLVDTKLNVDVYKILYYIPNETEYLKILSDIQAKNKSQNAELHSLRFIDINSPLSSNIRNITRKVKRFLVNYE